MFRHKTSLNLATVSFNLYRNPVLVGFNWEATSDHLHESKSGYSYSFVFCAVN